MSKTLLLAEKPSVGKDLARVLKCGKKGEGYLEGDKHIVTWALGHLVALAEPDAYDKRYSSWKMEDLPLLPEQLKLVVIKKSSKQFNIVKEQVNRKDVGEIVIATDAGREGELVARWIINKARAKKPVKRLWISSVTDKAIKEGLKNLKDGKEYESLYASAAARAEADWYVGINATRALTCRHNAQLSCGRVQTPTLAIIANREEEINNFQPQEFYRIIAASGDLKLTRLDSRTKDTRFFDEEQCAKVLASVENKNAEVVEVDKAYKKKNAPRLYDLTELQRDANRIFGLSAKETLSILQRLYEQHKLLTYPRTDSRYLSSDMMGDLKERVEALNTSPYSKYAARILKKPIKPDKSVVDDSKVTDHHAIIPTEQRADLSKLNSMEKKIYDLVARRFLAVLYPPFEYEQATLQAKIGEELFTARGKVVLARGWKEIYDKEFEEDEEENEEQTGEDVSEQILPEVQKGDTLKISSVYRTTGKTRPPQPFTEGTLLSAMENPVKYMEGENKNLVKSIGKAGGLGTVATRADIIEKLLKNMLIEKNGKYIHITSKGRQLLNLVPEELRSPALTARWEQKLESISRGELSKGKFIGEMKQYAKTVVNEIKNSESRFKHENLTGDKCPRCGRHMLEVNSKNGKMLVCQDRKCGYKKGISKITNNRCPQCRKKLELRGEGEGQVLVCRCGFREKLSTFNERRNKEKDGISKKEAQSYLKKQNKSEDEFTNPALAEALSKLKDK